MKRLSVPQRHQLKIAKDTMRLTCLGTNCLGGMDHQCAVAVIKEFTEQTVHVASDCICGPRDTVIPYTGQAKEEKENE